MIRRTLPDILKIGLGRKRKEVDSQLRGQDLQRHAYLQIGGAERGSC